MTRLSSNLPETANGLDAISDDLLKNPLEERIVVGIVHCPTAKEDFVNGRHIPYVAFRAIEPLTAGAGETARSLLVEAYTKRTGQESLPLDQIAVHEPDGKPCPAWWTEGDTDSEPCVYEAGHGGLHKLRSGHTWATSDGAGDADTPDAQPTFQEPEDANDD